MDEERKGFW